MRFKPNSRLALAGLFTASILCAPHMARADAKRDLAIRVVQVQQASAEALGHNLASQTAQQVLQTAGQAMGRVAPEKREAVGKDVQAEIKKFYDEVDPILRERAGKLAPTVLVPWLQEKFSEEELKILLAWLESPVSKKYQQLGGEMQNALGQKLIADTSPMIQPKLKALEATLQKKLGLPAVAASGSAPASAPVKPAAKKP